MRVIFGYATDVGRRPGGNPPADRMIEKLTLGTWFGGRLATLCGRSCLLAGLGDRRDNRAPQPAFVGPRVPVAGELWYP